MVHLLRGRGFAVTIALRSALASAVMVALSGCAPPGYVYDAGNFIRPHPTPALCASRGLVLDVSAGECGPPPSAFPLPVAEKQP